MFGPGAVPGRQEHFVQHFGSNGHARTQFVARAERLLDFAASLAQPFLLPFRFQCQVVGQNERSEILLRD